MVNYGVIEEKMCDSCMGEYITYGIGAYNTQAHELITFVSDVFHVRMTPKICECL